MRPAARSAAQIWIRDRGAGFDHGAVPDDRRGLTESVSGRMERVGGTAQIKSAAGNGTEIALQLPSSDTAA